MPWQVISGNLGSWWWTGRPGVLQFMRSQRVGHDWATELNSTEPTPVFWPGEFHGLYNPWDHKGSDMTEWLPLSLLMELRLFPDFPFGSDGKASVYNVRDLGSIPGLGRFPREGNGYTLQYSCLENPVGQRSLVKATVHGVAKSCTTEQLHFHFPLFYYFKLCFCEYPYT